MKVTIVWGTYNLTKPEDRDLLFSDLKDGEVILVELQSAVEVKIWRKVRVQEPSDRK